MPRNGERSATRTRRRDSTQPRHDLIAGPGGWHFAPEGAAVHLVERLAVIADVHLGYEWARGASGDMVPAHSLSETTEKLTRLLGRATIDRLVVAGDLVESLRPCPRTNRDVHALRTWLAERGVELVCLRGNHDPPRRPPLPTSMVVGGWTIAHGHQPIMAERLMIGHHHPVLRVGGVVAPSILVGPRLIALPAFSLNAAGLNVASTTALPPVFLDDELRTLAGLGDALLDFGPLATLAVRIRTF